MDDILRFQRDCHSSYLGDLRKLVTAFPARYTYPDGNPISPILPVQTALGKVMIIGAFPSARFESRQGRLIPVADNLSPFGPERYFDGREVRIQESAHRLEIEYLRPLGLSHEQLWLTDIVKVYLYPPKHIRNCEALFPKRRFTNTHKMFPQLARASREWFLKELEVCKPKLVITLGEVCARAVGLDRSSTVRELLDGQLRDLTANGAAKVVHLAHPEIRRVNRYWDETTSRQIAALRPVIRDFV